MSDFVTVPELRFSDFIGDWENKKLKDLSKVIDCKHRTPPYVCDGIPVVSPGSIKWGDIDLESPVKKVSEEEFMSLMNHCQPKYGDLVFSRNQSLGVACVVRENSKFVLGQDTVLIQSDDSSTFYIYYLLQTHKIQSLIMRLSGGSTFSRINLKDIRYLQIRFPFEESEQQKIAAFLGSVDDKLNKLRRKRELLETWKRGLVQKIFSQQLSFTQDDGTDFPDWEERELVDILDYEQPTSYLVTNTEYEDCFDTPVLTAGKTFLLGYTNETYGVFTDPLPVIIFDDFTTSAQFVDFPFKVKSSAMKILKKKEPDIQLKVIFDFMKLLRFPLGEHKRYWISEYQFLATPYPHPNEQQKIANFLSSVDKKIEAVTHQITQTETFKKGLLQKMFV